MHDINFLERLEELLEKILELIRDEIGSESAPPSAPTMTAFFDLNLGTHMSTVVLTDTLPTTREDGSALADTDIASITYQKASPSGSPPILGPPVILQTNTAVPPAPLTPADLTFTDPTPAPGDTYTSFVTDTAGHVSKPSAAFTVPATLSPPSAPGQTAVFTP